MGELTSITTYSTSPTTTSSFHMRGGEMNNLMEISLPLNCSEADPNATYVADRLKTFSGEKEKKRRIFKDVKT